MVGKESELHIKLRRNLRFWAGVCVLFLLTVGPPGVFAERFQFKDTAGDKYKSTITVEQEVYANNQLKYRSSFVNRETTEVKAVKGVMATINMTIQTAERAVNMDGKPRFNWDTEQRTVFDRDPFGKMFVNRQFVNPNVRDVPVFPVKDINPGDTWEAPGKEVYDFDIYFGVDHNTPYQLPFIAHYTYLGEKEWKGKTYKAIQVNYTIDNTPPSGVRPDMPSRITGASEQTIYWDSDLCQVMGAEENNSLKFIWPDGHSVEFRSKGEGITEKSAGMNRLKEAKNIAQALDKGGIKGADVAPTDNGVKLTLDNIHFDGDSAVLKPSEQAKLNAIIKALAPYHDRDLLVEGHTALAGKKEWRDKLSLDRAQAVANYIEEQGGRAPSHIVVEGHGADQPVADNSTERGRKKNRRVEITILEN
jgi:outer membrane protein OmpA-like peptidoglycan-associated protein